MSDAQQVAIAKTLGVMDEKLDTLTERVKAIDHTINGNGKPGMKIELDRLKEKDARREKWFWVLATALTGQTVVGVCGIIYAVMKMS